MAAVGRMRLSTLARLSGRRICIPSAGYPAIALAGGSIPETLRDGTLMFETLASAIQRFGLEAGDLHDIGKNIVAMVLTGAGLEVDNLGTDVPVSTFADAAERGVQVIGMSSLLTTTRPVMAQVVTVLEERGLRDRVKVVIGGAAVTDRFATQIGADAFGADATDAVRVVKRLLGV